MKTAILLLAALAFCARISAQTTAPSDGSDAGADIVGRMQDLRAQPAAARPPLPPAAPVARGGCEVPLAPAGASVDANIKEVLDEERELERLQDKVSPAWADPNAGVTNAQAVFINLAIWFKAKVVPNGPWDYKLQDKTAKCFDCSACSACSKYDDFGNFNFGATGAAAGFPEWFLHFQAGRLQAPPPGEKEKPQKWPGWPFQDDPRGYAQISAGYRYYRSCARR